MSMGGVAGSRSRETPCLDRDVPLPRPPRGAMIPAFGAGIGTVVVLIAVAALQFDSSAELRDRVWTSVRELLPLPLAAPRLLLVAAESALVVVAPTIIHEFGHVLAGLLAGFRYEGLHLGPVVFERPFRISRYRGGGFVTSGAAYMTPGKFDAFRLRCLAPFAGGPAANLCCAAVLLLLPYQKGVLSALFIFVSLGEGLSNLVSFKTAVVVSDGGRISMLLRNGPAAARLMALFKLSGALRRGALPETLAADDLADAVALRDDSPDTMVAHAIAWSAAYYRRDDDEAARLLDLALQHSGRGDPSVRVSLMSDAGVFQARRRKRTDLANAWLAELPAQVATTWLGARIEVAILEAEGHVEEAARRLEARERELAAVRDQAQREQFVTLTRRWRTELRGT